MVGRQVAACAFQLMNLASGRKRNLRILKLPGFIGYARPYAFHIIQIFPTRPCR